MALSHVTKEFGVNDAAVFKMLTDVAAQAPTYASKVDIPGIKSLESTLEAETKELRGDNTFLAADSVLRRITGKATYAKLGYDIWTAVSSVLATDSGTTPNQKVTMTLTQTSQVANFKLEAQSLGVDYVGGDVHVLMYKCIPSNLLAGFAEEDYREQSFDFTAMPLIGTITGGPATAWMSIISDETAVAIS